MSDNFPSMSVDYNYIPKMYVEEELSQLNKWKQTLVGRVKFKNSIGKLGFLRIDIQVNNDLSSLEKIQVMVRSNDVSAEDFAVFKSLTLGDWITVQGFLTRTRTGELTLNANTLALAAKCTNTMPDKLAGIADTELRYRQRYLDLIFNDDAKRVFKARSGIVSLLRMLLTTEYEFTEVETPILQAIPGGASARPFSTHHNSLGQDLYMRVAPELYLKKLLVAGMGNVFEIGKNFRNEGISTRHNPEFTTVEWYQPFTEYTQSMNIIERILQQMCYSKHLNLAGIDVKSVGNIPRVTYVDAVSKHCEPTVEAINAKYGKSFATLGRALEYVFEEFVEPGLTEPVFIINHPREISPLAKPIDDNFAGRFELYLGGREVANGFNELNDPEEQARIFREQAQLKSSGDEEAMFYDEDYINALSYGMPPAAGVGIGIDRLVMFFTGSESIKDVILFPTLRSKSAV